jgi:hypothetical protein
MTPLQGYMLRWAGEEEPGLPALLAALQRARWLPEGQSWWFGWCEQDIRLPQLLDDSAALPVDWDELRVFSSQAELRRLRRGNRWLNLLLCEHEDWARDVEGWALACSYPEVVGSHRILWGKALRLPGGEVRGEVRFPRRLAYGVSAGPDQPKLAVVADVQHYLDGEARLRTFRYGRLYYAAAGDAALRPVAPRSV